MLVFLLQDYTLSQLRRAQPDHQLLWKPEKFIGKVLSLFLPFALINVISFQVSIAVVDQMMAFWVSPPYTLEHVTATRCRDLNEDHQLIFHNFLPWILPSAMLLEDPWFRPKQETKYWVRWRNTCLLPEVPCVEFHHRDSLNNMKMSAQCLSVCRLLLDKVLGLWNKWRKSSDWPAWHRSIWSWIWKSLRIIVYWNLLLIWWYLMYLIWRHIVVCLMLIAEYPDRCSWVAGTAVLCLVGHILNFYTKTSYLWLKVLWFFSVPPHKYIDRISC